MLLIDANLLLYAYDAGSARHHRARTWLDDVLDGEEPVRIALMTLLAFVRIGTDPRVYQRPMDVPTAQGHVSEWLALPTVAIAEPTPEHWSILVRVATEGQARGPMVMDAHLAALALEHGARLCTTDRGFARFAGLRTFDPLA